MNERKSKAPPNLETLERVEEMSGYISIVNKLLKSIINHIAETVTDETERRRLIEFINDLIITN